jgi:hypothetical protein
MCVPRDFDTIFGRLVASDFASGQLLPGKFASTPDGNDVISADTERSGSEDLSNAWLFVATMPGSSEIFPIGLTRLVPGFKKVGSCEHVAPPNCPHCFFGSEGPVTFEYFGKPDFNQFGPVANWKYFERGSGSIIYCIPK